MPRKDRRFTCEDLLRLRKQAIQCDGTDDLLLGIIDFIKSNPAVPQVISLALAFLSFAITNSTKSADDALREFFEVRF